MTIVARTHRSYVMNMVVIHMRCPENMQVDDDDDDDG